MRHTDPMTRQLQLMPNLGGQGAALLCPECGENFLHHTEVTVFSRPAEDGPVTSTRIHPDAAVHVLPGHWKGNPSSRRDGLAVRFYCENCDVDAELTIAQHKGETSIQWRRAAR